MNRQALAKKRLPDTPGVYFFLKTRMNADTDADERRLPRRENILYIGRATSLRNRVRSYFAPDIAEKRSQWIAKMLTEAKSVDFRKTDSVLEAILLEADLIKRFKPPYNTELKDDKSFNYIVITEEDFPSVFIARSNNIDFDTRQLKTSHSKLKTIYGPFTNGFQLQTAMKIIRKIFPFRDQKCKPSPPSIPPLKRGEGKGGGRPCFNRQIGLCPGVCTGEITAQEYRRHIKRLALFLSCKTARAMRALKRAMKEAAKRQEFERAGELKRQLFALKHIRDIALIKRESFSASVPRSCSAPVQCTLRIEAYDLSHFGGKEIVGAMAVVEGGEAKPSEYRLFKLRGIQTQNEAAGLQEIIRRRLNHSEWRPPALIVVDGNEVQKNAAEAALAKAGQSIPVVAVVKDTRHRPREIIGFHRHTNILQNVGMSWREAERAILLANSEAHRFVLKFQRTRRLFLRGGNPSHSLCA